MIIFDNDIAHILSIINKDRYGALFYIVDKNVENLHNISSFFKSDYKYLICNITEKEKNANKLFEIIDFFQQNNASRSDTIVIIGGGVLTDVAGFACSIYKRGIKHINIPTTLMGMVDASIGGKTAINYNNIKNIIGSFHQPKDVIINLDFLKTLDQRELLSGYGELLKYSLLIDKEYFNNLMRLDFCESIDYDKLLYFIGEATNLKNRVVENDFEDKNIRQCLNAGHTIAHGIESLSMIKNYNITHGNAVAIGLVIELYISTKLLGTPRYILDSLICKVKEEYSRFLFPCKDVYTIIDALKHDKKNNDNSIVFSLIKDIGCCEITNICDESLIRESLDFYLDVFE